MFGENTALFSIIVSFAVVTAPADLFQKLPLHERPLLLRLRAGPDLQRLSFVLKENETGEVEVRHDCKHSAERGSVKANLLSSPPSTTPLSSTVACLFHPRAAKLPSDPGERGGGASPGSGAKIQHVQTETTAGPTTTRPLTPPPQPVTSSGQQERNPLSLKDPF